MIVDDETRNQTRRTTFVVIRQAAEHGHNVHRRSERNSKILGWAAVTLVIGTLCAVISSVDWDYLIAPIAAWAWALGESRAQHYKSNEAFLVARNMDLLADKLEEKIRECNAGS